MKEKIIDIIETILELPKGTIGEDTLMEDVEEWDSLAQVMIIGELDSKLGISIPLEEAMEIKGVADFLRICEK